MEKKQIIISVGRECGSGGRKIAKRLAERLNIQYYDHELIEKVARSANLDVNTVKQIDEKPASFFSGMYIPIENDIAFKEFSIIKKKADDGESFVIVGRCAEHVLRGNENLISIFVTGDMYDKKQRIMQKHNVSIEKATDIIIKTDKNKSKLAKKVAKENVSGTTSLSNNAIQNAKDLSKVNKHNLRDYDNRRELITTIYGTNDIVEDVKQVYLDEFEQARIEFELKE